MTAELDSVHSRCSRDRDAVSCETSLRQTMRVPPGSESMPPACHSQVAVSLPGQAQLMELVRGTAEEDCPVERVES